MSATEQGPQLSGLTLSIVNLVSELTPHFFQVAFCPKETIKVVTANGKKVKATCAYLDGKLYLTKHGLVRKSLMLFPGRVLTTLQIEFLPKGQRENLREILETKKVKLRRNQQTFFSH